MTSLCSTASPSSSLFWLCLSWLALFLYSSWTKRWVQIQCHHLVQPHHHLLHYSDCASVGSLCSSTVHEQKGESRFNVISFPSFSSSSLLLQHHFSNSFTSIFPLREQMKSSPPSLCEIWDKQLLSREPDRSWCHCHTTSIIKFFWSQPIAPWALTAAYGQCKKFSA